MRIDSIHAFNRCEEEGHVECKYNHFRLIDLTWEELYVMGVPAILDDEEEKILMTLMGSSKKPPALWMDVRNSDATHFSTKPFFPVGI